MKINIRIFALVVIGLLLVCAASCKKNATKKPANVPAVQELPPGDGLFAGISTSKGDIVVRLEFQKTPLTVCNFAGLAEGKLIASLGKPFYNGMTFHRVVTLANGDDQDFLIQSGAPGGIGGTGLGYTFPDEIVPSLKHDRPGILTMPNDGPNTNGSQFLITLAPAPWFDGSHTMFGEVVEGMDVCKSIRQGDIINKITIIRKGPLAEQFRTDQTGYNRLINANGTAAAQRLAALRADQIKQINTKFPTAKKTSSGIRYMILQTGSGPKPARGKKVEINYIGSFLNGWNFENSFVMGKPVEIVIGTGMVIKGWDETIKDMKVGERRLAVIPPELAYKERGNTPDGPVPPNWFLVYEIELVGIK